MSLVVDGTAGVERWVEFPNSAIPSATNYTLTAWINPSAYFGFLVNTLNVGSPFSGVSLAISGSGAPTIWDPNGFAYLVSTTQFAALNTWSLFAVRVFVSGGAGTVDVSLNGAPWENLKNGATSLFVPTTENRGQAIGRGPSYSNWITNSRLADIRHYSRQLSNTEIEILYNARTHDDILDYNLRWRLLEGSPHHTPGSAVAQSTRTESTTGTTFAVNMPSIAQNRDGLGMIAVIAVTGSGDPPPTITTPSGWTLRNSGQTNLPSTFSTPAVYIYTRNGGSSSEPATYNFNTSASATKIANVYAVHGISDTPDVVSSINTGTSTSPVSPSVSPSGNAFVLRVCCTDAETVPGTFGTFYPNSVNGRSVSSLTGLGNGLTLAVADRMRPSGATGTVTWNPSASEQWGCLTLAWLGGTGLENGPKDEGLSLLHGFTYGDARFDEERVF